jgi:NAD(P)-dependent dehydrogenase (short-subunit alcohol dehydrogenase family)
MGESKHLQGKVAVVTGASRGIGKGIALELGAAGATVYVTGRSIDPGKLPGTVSKTADEIDQLGGKGIAVPCDHHVDDAVEAVFAQIEREQGRLDVLVNNVYDAPGSARWLGKTFWEVGPKGWDHTFEIGVRSHYVASHFAAKMLIGSQGLIVSVSSPGAIAYTHNVVYGVAKAAVDRMTVDMALELKDHGVTVASIWPGIVNTELLQMIPAGEDGRRILSLPGEGDFDLADAETPHYSGRAVVALATDHERMGKSGRAFYVADLADEYGFTDIDGRRPRRTEPTS